MYKPYRNTHSFYPCRSVWVKHLWYVAWKKKKFIRQVESDTQPKLQRVFYSSLHFLRYFQDSVQMETDGHLRLQLSGKFHFMVHPINVSVFKWTCLVLKTQQKLNFSSSPSCWALVKVFCVSKWWSQLKNSCPQAMSNSRNNSRDCVALSTGQTHVGVAWYCLTCWQTLLVGTREKLLNSKEIEGRFKAACPCTQHQ